MAQGTRKAGSSGRLGARYGVRVRKRIRDLEEKKSTNYSCPSCKYQALRRESAGIWNCSHCGGKFAGGAFMPRAPKVRTRKVAPAAAEAEELAPEEMAYKKGKDDDEDDKPEETEEVEVDAGGDLEITKPAEKKR